MRTSSLRGLAIGGWLACSSLAVLAEDSAEKPATPPEPKRPAVAARPPATPENLRAAARWKQFREHMESLGKKDLLPEEQEGSKPPSEDAILGTLFKLSPDLAAAHESLEREPPDLAGARVRLSKLEGTEDPYLADYRTLLRARADLAGKDFPAAQKGFEAVLHSTRNLATPAARRGLAECYRGTGEVTLEVLELRFLLLALPSGRSADRSWAEERLAEIRRDHPGPLEDSAKRMQELSTRLGSAEAGEGAAKDEKKVEEILEKVAQLLEEEGKRRLAMMEMQSASSKAAAARRKAGQKGEPKDGKKTGPANQSATAKTEAGKKNLRDPSAKDSDAWGGVNEREVAKSLQDLWGKIPPSYRGVVAAYFKDISGLKTEPPPPAAGAPPPPSARAAPAAGSAPPAPLKPSAANPAPSPAGTKAAPTAGAGRSGQG
jgi:hypothetical protein